MNGHLSVMSAWDAGHLPHVLQNAIHSNDLLTIKRHLPKSQDDLDAALLIAMPHCAIPTIKFLLRAGKVVEEEAFYKAISRKDTAIFEAMMENGWHVDDTPSERTAVQ